MDLCIYEDSTTDLITAPPRRTVVVQPPAETVAPPAAGHLVTVVATPAPNLARFTAIL